MTENDRTLGPITIGPWKNKFCLEFSSADFVEEIGARDFIRAIGFGWAIRLRLPSRILKPIRSLSGHDSTSYGISLSNLGNGYDLFTVEFGPQTYDSSTSKSWSLLLPWKQWRHIRTSYYGRDGEHVFTAKHGTDFHIENDQRELCPKRQFEFEDFDGARIVAKTHIEEREWHRGEGWFKWLRLFFKPAIRRSLDIQFNQGVGPQKGSWKGGVLGHSIDMLPGESQESAFRRYCQVGLTRKHKCVLKFLREL